MNVQLQEIKNIFIKNRLVANSGSFTVEGDVEPETHTGLQQIYQNKLIEGADYETYDWLKGSVPLGTIMMSLPINSSNCNFTYIWGNSLGNMSVFSTNGFQYYNGNNQSTNTLMVYDLATAQNIYSKYDITQPTTVNASDDALMINNSIYPKYGFPITFIRFQNAANGTSEGVKILSSISVDGVTRYVPCKLLHSIPRNLDAQCKERVAGECGMIDLISGKFYGNVASSGTFTVENDTENNE